MAFLASFLRTLTLAFAALHFLDPAPLGRGPRAPPRAPFGGAPGDGFGGGSPPPRPPASSAPYGPPGQGLAARARAERDDARQQDTRTRRQIWQD